MKSHLFLLTILLICVSVGKAAIKDSVNVLYNKTNQLAKNDSIILVKIDTTNSQINKLASDPCKECCNKQLGWDEYILIFLPVGLFLILFGLIVWWLIDSGYKLADALSGVLPDSFDTTETTTDTGDPAKAKTTISKQPNYVRSSSRLIAFLAGVVALICAVCMVSYYAYFTVHQCGGTPNYGDLWKILAGLGIGIVPYAVNVWRGNSKENP